MNKSQLFLFAIIIFYVSNIALPSIHGFLIIWKWAVLFLLVFVFYAHTTFREKSEYFFPDHLYLAFGSMVVYAITVTYLSTEAFTGIYKILGLTFILILASRLSKYFMVAEHNGSFCRSMITVGMLVVFSSVILYALGINMGRGAGETRFSGWTDNPNTLGMMLLPIYPILLLFSFKVKKISLTSPRVLLVLAIVVVVLTGSRASLAAIGVSTLVIVSFQEGGKIKLVLLGIISLLVVALVGSELREAMENMAAFQRSETLVLSGREQVWALGIMLIGENPYFGYGFDEEVALISQYSHLLHDHQGKVFHNSYLSYVVHLGFIGAVPLIWLIAVSLKNLLTLKTNSSSYQEMNMKLIAGAMVLSSLVHAIFETWLFSPGNLATLLFWIALFSLNSQKRIIRSN